MKFTLNNQQLFPTGTTVKAHPASNWGQANLPPAGAPLGAAAGEAVVAADGSAEFPELAEKTAYYAVGKVGSTYYYERFLTGVKGVSIVAIGAAGEAGKALAADDPVILGFGGAPVYAAAYGVAAANANNGPALKTAFAAAVGGTLILPAGIIKASEALGKYKCNLLGAGMQATQLKCTAKLGAGVSFLEFEEPAGTNAVFTIRGMTINGPGTYVLGERTANCDGLELLNTHRMEDVRVANFNAGFVSNSTGGHLYWTGCEATNNYYGVYQELNQSDFIFRDCTINGNAFAGFGCPSDQGWDSLVVESSHIGYQPFAFYQEATPENQGGKVFIQGAQFIHARFESLGNGCFYSAASNVGANSSKFRDVTIIDPGHSVNTGVYRLESQPHDYAFHIPVAQGTILILADPSPFKAYGLGIFDFRKGAVQVVNVAANALATDMAAPELAGPRYIFGSRLLSTFDLRASIVPVAANRVLPVAPVLNETDLVDATAGSVTITLPKASAAWSEGRGSFVTTIKRVDATVNSVIVKASEGKIDGKESVTLAAFQSCTFVSDGTNYWIV